MKLHAFGDSFVAGDQDIEGQDIEFLRYNVSFAALIAKQKNIELANYAEPGTGNYPQLDLLTACLRDNKITQSDLVLFGLTSTSRDRCSFMSSRGHNPIINQTGIFENWELLLETDQIYILSVLEKLSQTYGVRIVKFNVFDNALHSSRFAFYDYLSGGTLIDILNDTWGDNLDRPTHHGANSIPDVYKKFYTKNLHPSVEGHAKIADWFIQRNF